MVKTRWILLPIALVALAWLAFSVTRAMQAGKPSADALFATQMNDLAGVRQPFRQWRGQVLVVNFWASWCVPCRAEIPALIALQNQYAAHGVQVISIALENKASAARFANAAHINYPVLLGDLEAVSVARSCGDRLGTLPYTLVIDRQGKIVSSHAGSFDPAMLHTILAHS